jgi:hypothetical protein
MSEKAPRVTVSGRKWPSGSPGFPLLHHLSACAPRIPRRAAHSRRSRRVVDTLSREGAFSTFPRAPTWRFPPACVEDSSSCSPSRECDPARRAAGLVGARSFVESSPRRITTPVPMPLLAFIAAATQATSRPPRRGGSAHGRRRGRRAPSPAERRPPKRFPRLISPRARSGSRARAARCRLHVRRPLRSTPP